jgi:hypothetical protein
MAIELTGLRDFEDLFEQENKVINKLKTITRKKVKDFIFQ